MADGNSDNIVLFHYSFSPYARRIIWYLGLRGIEYQQCVQPPYLPRPDLDALGIKYRRIPLLSIGRDVYCDTRLIIQKLEERFPDGALGASQPDHLAVQRLLDRYMIDGGVFVRAAQLIPPDMPLMKDEKFTKDRQQFSGRQWSSEAQAKGRPEALVHIRDAWELMETTLLADGRDWILKTEKPSLADIEAIWPFHWMVGMKGALDPQYIRKEDFPKVFAWVDRFEKYYKGLSVPKPQTIKGPEALKAVTSAGLNEKDGKRDPKDPTGLKLGETVEFYPIDSGFSHHDEGRLVSLTAQEVVIAVRPPGGGQEIHLHAPRWGFRVQRAKAKM